MVTAHTASGKTSVAIWAIHKALQADKRIIYTSPIKTLSNQINNDLCKKFGKDSVGIITGDIVNNPSAPILIMTTEILMHALMRFKDSEKDSEKEVNTTIEKETLYHNMHQLLHNVTTVVFDEVHYINNKERGQVWEKSLMMLPVTINCVMLSATIANALEFCKWLHNIRSTNVTLVPTKRRVVPLEHYIYVNQDNVQKIVSKDNIFDRKAYVEACMRRRDLVKHDARQMQPSVIINNYLEYLSLEGMLPAIMFVLSKKNCEKYAASAPTLIDHTVAGEIRKQFHSLTAQYRKLYETVPQYHTLLANLERGVGVHHAGMIPVLKETVEILFQQGLLKVLFVTETFAVGVNMPAKVATFTGLEKYCNDGFRHLTTDEYKQMAGRAGRRGLDTIGISMLLPLREPLDGGELESIMVGDCSKVQSKFGFNYQFILNTLSTNASSMDQAVKLVVDFAQKSLLNCELDATKTATLEQHKSLDTTPPFPTKAMDDLAHYHAMTTQLQQGGMRKKHYVKLKKAHAEMETTMPNLKKQYTVYVDHLDKCTQAKYHQDALDAQDVFLYTHATQSIQYLVKQEYLTATCQPTLRGLIAGNINECNEIILTEMMMCLMADNSSEGHLDDLAANANVNTNVNANVNNEAFAITIAILAMMIPMEQHDMTMDDLIVPQQVKHYIKHVDYVVQSMEKDEFDAGIQLHNDWNLYIGFINAAYLWAQGKSIEEILAVEPMMEGDFIKNIIRLNSIVGQMTRVCELTKQATLLKTLELAEQKLIRDFVTLDSLYV